MGEHGRGDVDLAHGTLDLLGQLDTEGILPFRLIHHAEPVGGSRHGRSLDHQREDRDEEDDVEEHPGMRNLRDQGVGGEDDRHRSTQAYPRDVALSLERVMLEGNQAEEHTDGTCDQDHEDTHQDAHSRHGQHLVRIDQESQREEHHDLPEPGETLEEGTHALLVHDLGVAHHQSGQIDRQVAVTLAERGGREGEEGGR